MLTIATQHVARVPADKSEEIMRLFNETAIAIYEGQQFDMDFERRSDVTQQEYINMITLKTSVLLGCACKMGAIIANSDDETANLFYDLGTNVGIAFQLQDDMLDVWGDEATFGKEIGGDIMNNKKTLLLINALQRADEDRLNQLRRWLTDRYAMKKEKVPAVTRIFEELGLPAVINAEIDHYNNLALEALNKLKLNDEAKAAFNKLIATLVHRTK